MPSRRLESGEEEAFVITNRVSATQRFLLPLPFFGNFHRLTPAVFIISEILLSITSPQSAFIFVI